MDTTSIETSDSSAAVRTRAGNTTIAVYRSDDYLPESQAVRS